MYKALMLLIFCCNIAAADVVYWASGDVWRDVTVYQTIIDATTVRVFVQRGEDTRWHTGAVRVIHDIPRPESAHPVADATAELPAPDPARRHPKPAWMTGTVTD